LHHEIALNYITNKKALRNIIENSKIEREKVETALRLGDQHISKKLVPEIQDEELQLRMAQSVNDRGILSKMSGKATNQRVRQMAGEWISELDPESDSDID
jgi:hypothetical protein